MTENDRTPTLHLDEAFADEDSNTSGNPHFSEVFQSRRNLLKGGVGMAVAVGLFGKAGFAEAMLPEWAQGNPAAPTGPLLGFNAIPVSRADAITVPAGYRADVILPWGQPILGSYPGYAGDGSNTAAEQAQQIGQNHDGMHYFPMSRGQAGSAHGVLVFNQEYIDANTLHPNGATTVGGVRPSEEVAKEINAHGISVVEIRKQNGSWQVVPGRYNRRITGATPMEIGGPVRGHALVRTAYSPNGTRTRGTLNNCANGHTPWGTYLTCEENWANYFVNRDAVPPREHKRYGVKASSNYAWETAEPRFNAGIAGASSTQDYRNEPNTYGWVVEIDPFDPNSTPVKRTALGRFAHENVAHSKPRAGQPLAFYMGDDTANEYIYKFVTRDAYTPGRSDGSMLDHGTLYVARFNADGGGEWLPLDFDDAGFQAAAFAKGVAFESQADVLVNTRLAADVVGATKMDRPEWGAVDPRSGWIYFTLTNNSSRAAGAVDAANPRGPNAYGHIVRFAEHGGRNDATRFDWDLFLLAGPTTDSNKPDNSGPLDADSIHASPDGLHFDERGLLWIQTDMSGSQLYAGPFGNNQMLVANPATNEIKRFLTGPVGCEITGVTSTPDGRTLFINIQHPGDEPSQGASHWPDGGSARPRAATVVITREDGGIVGT